MKKIFYMVAMFATMPFFVIAPSAYALELSPIFFDLSAKPGDMLEQFITLKNDTKATTTLSYQVGIIETATADGTSAQLLPKPTDENTIADWISVSSPTVKLKAGESKQIPFTIRVPADAAPGGHYAWIAYSEAPTAVKGSQVAIAGGIATQVLLKVEGDVQEALTVQSFQTKTGVKSFETLPITFVAEVFNDGTVHQKPTGTVEIKNMFGTTVATLPFNTDTKGGNILPRSGRSYETTWDKGFAFGRYTAQLSAQYADGKTVTEKTTVWVLPKALLAVWALIILIAAMLTIGAITRRTRHASSSLKRK